MGTATARSITPFTTTSHESNNDAASDAAYDRLLDAREGAANLGACDPSGPDLMRARRGVAELLERVHA